MKGMTIRVHLIAIAILAGILYYPSFLQLEKKSNRKRHWQTGYGRLHDLRQIAIAMTAFADRDLTQARLPERIWDLHPEEIRDASLLACPADFKAENDFDENGFELNRYHYFFKGGESLYNIPSSMPLLCYPFRRGDDICYTVVFVDCHSELARQEEFIDILRQLYRWRETR